MAKEVFETVEFWRACGSSHTGEAITVFECCETTRAGNRTQHAIVVLRLAYKAPHWHLARTLGVSTLMMRDASLHECLACLASAGFAMPDGPILRAMAERGRGV